MWGLLRSSHIGIAFVSVGVVCVVTIAIDFRGFGILDFIGKIELGVGRVVAKESHSLFWGVAIVNPGKEV